LRGYTHLTVAIFTTIRRHPLHLRPRRQLHPRLRRRPALHPRRRLLPLLRRLLPLHRPILLLAVQSFCCNSPRGNSRCVFITRSPLLPACLKPVSRRHGRLVPRQPTGQGLMYTDLPLLASVVRVTSPSGIVATFSMCGVYRPELHTWCLFLAVIQEIW